MTPPPSPRQGPCVCVVLRENAQIEPKGFSEIFSRGCSEAFTQDPEGALVVQLFGRVNRLGARGRRPRGMDGTNDDESMYAMFGVGVNEATGRVGGLRSKIFARSAQGRWAKAAFQHRLVRILRKGQMEVKSTPEGSREQIGDFADSPSQSSRGDIGRTHRPSIADVRASVANRTFSKVITSVSSTAMSLLGRFDQGQLEVDFEHGDLSVRGGSEASSAIPYHLQGDVEMYSDEALAAREALRSHRWLQARVRELWQLMIEFQNGASGGGGGFEFDSDPEEEVLLEATYKELVVRVTLALIGGTETEARESAEDDWAVDSQGNQKMDYDLFFDGIFGLADTWVNEIDGDLYANFILAITRHISVKLKRGRSATLKDVSDIGVLDTSDLMQKGVAPSKADKAEKKGEVGRDVAHKSGSRNAKRESDRGSKGKSNPEQISKGRRSLPPINEKVAVASRQDKGMADSGESDVTDMSSKERFLNVLTGNSVLDNIIKSWEGTQEELDEYLSVAGRSLGIPDSVIANARGLGVGKAGTKNLQGRVVVEERFEIFKPMRGRGGSDFDSSALKGDAYADEKEGVLSVGYALDSRTKVGGKKNGKGKKSLGLKQGNIDQVIGFSDFGREGKVVHSKHKWEDITDEDRAQLLSVHESRKRATFLPDVSNAITGAGVSGESDSGRFSEQSSSYTAMRAAESSSVGKNKRKKDRAASKAPQVNSQTPENPDTIKLNGGKHPPQGRPPREAKGRRRSADLEPLLPRIEEPRVRLSVSRNCVRAVGGSVGPPIEPNIRAELVGMDVLEISPRSPDQKRTRNQSKFKVPAHVDTSDLRHPPRPSYPALDVESMRVPMLKRRVRADSQAFSPTLF